MKLSTKARLVQDMQFVVSECDRFQSILKRSLEEKALADTHERISDTDALADLPSRIFGHVTCGIKAYLRLRSLAKHALKNSDVSSAVHLDNVFRPLRAIVAERFIEERRPVDEAQVEKALAAAVKQAKRDRKNVRHFVPCRLMYASGPHQFSIGSVIFRTQQKFKDLMGPAFEQFPGQDAAKASVLHSELKTAKYYYERFTWIAEVEIFRCDHKISKQRAFTAVTAALNIFHALVGSYDTKKMAVGGPKLDEDDRAHMQITEGQGLHVSNSWSSTSSVSFPENWGEFLGGKNIHLLLMAAAKVIEPLTDPSIVRPMAMRFVDAAFWFGDAVREPSDAGRVVKSITALERLVMTDDNSDVSKTLCERAAAILYNSRNEMSFDDLNRKLAAAYDLRSRLVHGAISPFDSEVSEKSEECILLAEEAIWRGLGFFDSQGLFARSISNKQLSQGLDHFVQLVKEDSKDNEVA